MDEGMLSRMDEGEDDQQERVPVAAKLYGPDGELINDIESTG